MAVRPVGTPLGSLLGPGYRGPPRVVRPRAPAADDEAWQWSPAPSHGLADRLWAGCRLVALAGVLATVLTAGVLGAGAGVWLWLGHLSSAAPHH